MFVQAPVKELTIRVLGPLMVDIGGRSLPVGSAQRRSVLAQLVLDAGKAVSLDRIIAEVWGHRPPSSAKSQLHVHISALRRMLRDAGGTGEDLIVTTSQGYLLRVDGDQVDAERFLAGAARARQLLTNNPARAADQLRAALRLWHGPAFADVTAGAARIAADRLEEARLGALQDRIDADLALARHGELVSELTELVAKHPLRERFRGQLMVALYRSGRTADALGAYRQWRRVSVAEHGIEPDQRLQAIHQAILRDDDPEPAAVRFAAKGSEPVPGTADAADSMGIPAAPAPAPAPAVPTPAQLPMGVSPYVGRRTALARLDSLLSAGDRGGSRVVAVVGPAGVGKTALATRWAHTVADRFPDGQLYVDLHGSSGTPLQPVQALARLLKFLGVPAERIPLDVEEAAATYRATLANRRVLVFLDDAADVTQLRSLVPGDSCFLLVTSRDRLTGLVADLGARKLTLGRLSLPESVELVSSVLGAADEDPVAVSDTAALAELCRVCDRWPLALRIAAANLLETDRQSIAEYTAELTETGAIAGLSIDGDERFGVRAAFDLSYRRCPPEAQRLFRGLGLAAGPEIGIPAAAAMGQLGGRQTRQLLDRLASVHLVEHSAGRRYRMHDLVRAYAKDLAGAEDDSAERARMVRRMLEWQLAVADAADRVIIPQRPRPDPLPHRCGSLPAFTGEPDAVAWYESERPNLLAAVDLAVSHRFLDLAWRIPVACFSFYFKHKNFAEYVTMARSGLAAAEQLEDRTGQAYTLTALALSHYDLRRFEEATPYFRRALDFWSRIDDPWGEAIAHIGLAVTLRDLDNHQEAAVYFQRSIAIWEQLGDKWGLGIALHNLGDSLRRLRQFGAAFHNYQRSLRIRRDVGDAYGEAWTLHDIGQCHLDIGEVGRAKDCFLKALNLRRQINDRHGQACTLYILGQLAHRRSERGAGEQAWRTALEIFAELDPPRAAALRHEIDRTLASTHPGVA